MKLFKLGIALIVCATLVPAAAHAQFDFVGDATPLNGDVINTTISTQVTFEFSVFDDGRTNNSDTERTEGIGAILKWKDSATDGPYTEVPMVWNRKGGPFGPSNDIFQLQVPLATFAGIQEVEWTACAVDSASANLTQEISTDADGNAPPLTFTFSEIQLTDVTVTFQLCTNGIDSMLTKFDNGVPIPFDITQDICIAGNTAELDNFGNNGPVLVQSMENTDYFTVSVLFPAGGPETVSYKYRVNGCDLFELEGLGNDRTFTLDYTTANVTLDLDLLDDVDTDPTSSTCSGTPVETKTWSSIKSLFGN
ncbi:MAG: hypothetical protein HKN21_10820 [Candidatus Eisenbacteria bacterium]|uniref:Uncharacterized protein n=1 Tax=Eiseniibacteriota bacterium TaxID=2212470 RepID=A0A7Y2EA33_UNCEI|nr:hypothetical protein [Candidatus Eisenbacteria bacterium]